MERGLKQREKHVPFSSADAKKARTSINACLTTRNGRVTDLTSYGFTFLEKSLGKEIDTWILLF
jgi:hypothetical protein